MKHLITPIAEELKITVAQVENTLALLEEGNTVPFIARYRKEKTNGLDEEQILYISEQYKYQQNLEKRKDDVLRLIETQGKLTDELKKEVLSCTKISQVDDIYRPYAQKKKTRATDAIAKGLQPLADWIVKCPKSGDVMHEAQKYVKDDVTDVKEALQGAKDIIAEMVSDDAKLRWKVKDSIYNYGRIVTKEKKKHEDEAKVYQMYYDYNERVNTIANHRIMAIDRAEKEKVITVTFTYNVEYLVTYAFNRFTNKRMTIVSDVLTEAITDGYKRLLLPSVEREVRAELSERAQNQSIEIFSMNLEKLLLQPPMKGKIVLGFDPAYRTGCKLAVLDPTGKCLHIDKIFPTPPMARIKESTVTLLNLIRKYGIEIIAIGNGTASRESESFVAKVIRENNLNVAYTLVSEAGASVYSASEIARKEFPDFHVEERSAVSIGRRILDPLSELIKIDPKSIGVGQYQHDLPQKQLTEKLDFAVLKSVNRVGVDLNTASVELLSHVAGLNKANAQAIVDYRNENGKFTNRKQLKNVKKMGDKTFTQCAGFLRIVDGDEPLDQTSIHPESYEAAKAFMNRYHVETLGKPIVLQESMESIARELNSDVYTVQDMIDNITQPLRDYRDRYAAPVLRSDVLELEDLTEGQQLEGVVRNVVDFGAFVDIGLHEDGLVHASKMSKEKIGHPSEVVSVGDIVTVWVFKIDTARKKVQLSLVEQ
ncbi:MAG: RNA-binding transcriptional accessory protein [Erysipelotrichaceae bacterium]|nr:RNA-binding transcriptional accessory protein [Erysipelotrichaceae bacterium]